MWRQWVNFLIGLAVLYSGLTGAYSTRYILAGIVVAALALWSALGGKKAGPMA